ncbi:MAG: helix-turn-helix transcriptional regulator [Paludibacteraceae bacterium]|nr:helix-turn-helix transcriptional regulator [Paludibacteraceae bacterium]
MGNLEILNELTVRQSDWRTRVHERKENKDWLELSAKIAFRILKQLDVLGMSQKELAEKLNVTPQCVNKYVKGRENFSIKTICSLEKVLGCSLRSDAICSSITVKPIIFYYNKQDYLKSSASFKQSIKIGSLSESCADKSFSYRYEYTIQSGKNRKQSICRIP